MGIVVGLCWLRGFSSAWSDEPMYTQDDFMRLFGEISVRFATWDLFASLVTIALKRPEKNRELSRMTLGQKIDFLGTLDPSINPVVMGHINARLNQDKAVSSERNRYVHDLWELNSDFMSKGKIRRMSVRFPEADSPVVDIVETIHTMAELQSFSEMIRESMEVYMKLALELGAITKPD